MPDYSFVISNNFKPFTLQEMLVPMQAYKTAYDEMEKNYNELSDKTDAFKYLSETLPEGSKARQLYEGYAKEVEEGAKSLSEGLTMSNRRTYSQLRKRYMGEIGRLEKADTALQKEIERRTTLNSTDPTTLYATDNISIDDFLDRKRPNSYSVSGQKLYERGVQIGASGSSRIYSNPQVQALTKKYNDIIQSVGYSPELVVQFRNNLAAIPEFQRSIEATLKEYGATDNLTGVNLDRAKQSVINGVVNGITYKKSDNVQQDPDYITKAQELQLAHQADQLALQAAGAGMKKVDGKWVWDKNTDPSFQKAKAVTELKGKTGKDSGGSTTHNTIAKQATKIEWNKDNPASSEEAENDYDIRNYALGSSGEETKHQGKLTKYDDLPDYAKRKVTQIIKDGNFDYYDIYFQPEETGALFWKDKITLEVVPRNIVSDNKEDIDASIFGQVGNLSGDLEYANRTITRP